MHSQILNLQQHIHQRIALHKFITVFIDNHKRRVSGHDESCDQRTKFYRRMIYNEHVCFERKISDRDDYIGRRLNASIMTYLSRQCMTN